MPPKQSRPAASSTQKQSTVARRSSRSLFEILGSSAGILTLAALASPISQATLAPVFGSIPAAINHDKAIAATPFLGFLWRWQSKSLPPETVLGYVAAWAFWIPVVSMYLFRCSASLGIVYGPVLIGFLSCHAIIIGCTYAVAAMLEDLHLDEKLGQMSAPLVLAFSGQFHIVSFERFFRTLLPGLQTLTSMFTPVKTQALIASTLAYLSHSRVALLGIPALVHIFSANPRFDSGRTLNTLNNTLHQQNWSVVGRQWSNTGYISVLDNLDQDFRVMRADHSLLGGEWLLTDQRKNKEGWQGNEPIYAVFEMLEAVRLVPTEPAIVDSEAHALVVGLGIGTAPKAFLGHGINTTVIELDPAVHEYAVKYFDLPENHTSILQDAVSAVSNLATTSPPTQYDYIIHDVFTGGAEPLPLFTNTFLRNLRALLRPNGIIAVNYAGQASSPLTAKVLRTIRSTFGPSCRAFRDTPPSDDDASEKKQEEEDIVASFANMVIFCRSSPDLREPVTFRQPGVADFLGRKSARQYLLPNPEYEVALPELLPRGEDGDGAEDEGLLLESGVGEWNEQQMQSAIRHWRIMREVLPDFVWELW